MSDTRPAYALRIHDRAAVVPFPDPEQHGDLTDDIAAHGVQVPLDILDDGTILDGRTRYSIARALGITDLPVRVVRTADPVGYMLRMALRRRHLTTQQRKALAESLMRMDPGRSDRGIAHETGLSHPTVAAVRADLEASGRLESPSSRTGLDGRTRAVRERAPEPTPAAELMQDPEVAAEVYAGLNEAAARSETTPVRRAPDPMGPLTPAHVERFPHLAATELSRDVAVAVAEVRTDRLDPAKWAERVPQMRPEDLASIRSKVAHVHRWADAWDAVLAPRPLSIVGGSK